MTWQHSVIYYKIIHFSPFQIPLMILYQGFMWFWSIIIFLATLYILNIHYKEIDENITHHDPMKMISNTSTHAIKCIKKHHTSLKTYLNQKKSKIAMSGNCVTTQKNSIEKLSTLSGRDNILNKDTENNNTIQKLNWIQYNENVQSSVHNNGGGGKKQYNSTKDCKSNACNKHMNDGNINTNLIDEEESFNVHPTLTKEMTMKPLISRAKKLDRLFFKLSLLILFTVNIIMLLKITHHRRQSK